MSPALERFLLDLTGQTVASPGLFEQALTHRSLGRVNNERLEFLGDALLGFVIAEALMRRFPDADEGALSRARSALVKQESLAAQARALHLGERLRLGSGELRTGGHTRDSILADAFEALIGAVYLDQGFTAAEALILRLFAEPLRHVAAHLPDKDPKTQLQEWLQSQHRPLPEYEVVEIAGKQHDQRFAVRCRLRDAEVTREADASAETIGSGTSRRRAEQAAASAMLARLNGGHGDG